MKRFYICALAAIALCGCQTKELELDYQVAKSPTLTATIEDDFFDETKTSLDEYCNVLWKQGDQISAFLGSAINQQYQVTDDSDGKTSAELYQVSSGLSAGTEISNNVAFYPYQSTATIAKNESAYVISDITLPATQTYAANSFGNGAFPMAAVTSSTTDMNLKFKNVLGGLKLQLTGTASIASISVTGNNDEILCGAATVTSSNGSTPSINLTDASAKTVTLNCGSVALDETTPTSFIIALPPMTMTGGFTVVVTDTQSKQMEIKTTKSQTIARSGILKMPAKEYVGTGMVSAGCIDLGLSVYWATCNLGASNPEDYGDYYAWGETAPHSPVKYSWFEYSLCNAYYNMYGVGYNMTKYCTDDYYGTIDNKTTLDFEDDAAYVNWGDSWRMPTTEEQQELINNCFFQWTSNYNSTGVQGMIVYKAKSDADKGKRTSPVCSYSLSDTHIFLPAVGYFQYSESEDSGGCYYWLNSLYNTSSAYILSCFSSHLGDSDSREERYIGMPIRPVWQGGEVIPVTAISLSQSSLNLSLNENANLIATITPVNATHKTINWSSNNPNVATVSAYGVVTPVSYGSATITAKDANYEISATCDVTVSPGSVDLGLSSGLKWATTNIGAQNPEDSGDYFAWGETSPKTHFDCGTYKYCTDYGDDEGPVYLTKYITDANYYSGYDNLTRLENMDDAAYVNWGPEWHTPTVNDFTELIEQCSWQWTTSNGINGYRVTGPNNNSIFLPATGYYEYVTLYNSMSYYLSSDLSTMEDEWFQALRLTNEVYYIVNTYSDRYSTGCAVRPVK